MDTLKIESWGDSYGLRLPKKAMDYLEIQTGDEVTFIFEINHGRYQLIIEAKNPSTLNELTIEELFSGYTTKKFQTSLQNLGEPIGYEIR
ncbi:hypothetical protein BAU15_14270 [Enterococcus sp. JM4C]|uniref:AbrB/MazE/SpoVT family DNA-binding domain-containing protein n=1 Tax=Candidatus Enterococcus huntleyi TaxID=1857217 RepID=UPI00137B4FF2|nr:PbsX family transcriptional regulator [Enterococcus sp. JM4C]KAF1298844.1 hypothetical protein BAU15_14270 [Enterococcus sp. JM4C]